VRLKLVLFGSSSFDQQMLPVPACCQVDGSLGKFLTNIMRHNTTFHARGLTALGQWAILTASFYENPSRACLVLLGVLRIYLARYFTTPSRQRGPGD
jgi:hypothetical protein